MRRCYGFWTDRDFSTSRSSPIPTSSSICREISSFRASIAASSGLRSDQQLPMKVEVREERQFTSTAALLELAEDGAE